MKVCQPILLVEDNPKDLELALEGLSEFNLANEIAIARDGAEALDYIYGKGKWEGFDGPLPCVILLDLKLPKVGGLEVLKRIKEDPDKKRIPVVVLTSSREESDLLTSYDLGANAFVVKPVEFKDFIRAMKEIGFFWALLNERPSPPLNREHR